MEERHGGNDRYDSNEQRMHMHQICCPVLSGWNAEMICPLPAPKAQHHTDKRDFNDVPGIDRFLTLDRIRTKRSVKEIQDMKERFMQRIKETHNRMKFKIKIQADVS